MQNDVSTWCAEREYNFTERIQYIFFYQFTKLCSVKRYETLNYRCIDIDQYYTFLNDFLEIDLRT